MKQNLFILRLLTPPPPPAPPPDTSDQQGLWSEAQLDQDERVAA